MFATELKKIGYDINYRKYLKKYNDELDEFAVLIDRDMQTHSESNMLECIKYCRDNGYKCYIANPCFEFWLLMHLADIEVEFGDQLDEIKENKKVSEQHTFVSKEVSDRAHHGKSGINLYTVDSEYLYKTGANLYDRYRFAPVFISLHSYQASGSSPAGLVTRGAGHPKSCGQYRPDALGFR